MGIPTAAYLGLIPTTAGILMVWTGMAIAAGPGLAAACAVVGLIPVVIGVVLGLRARREREASPPTAAVTREQARHSYDLMRRSAIVFAISTPVLFAVTIWMVGFTTGTALIAGGLAVLLVTGISSERRLLARLREEAGLAGS